MRKIRILQFSITNSGGGVTQYVLNNWKYIDHNKFQFDFVTFFPCLDFEEQLLSEGCKVFHVNCRAEDNLDKFKEQMRVILANRYDVIHLHTNFWKGLHMEGLAREAHIPKIIIHAHNSGIYDDNNREEKTKCHEFIKNQINTNIATDFWACSWKAAEFLYGKQIPKDKIKIMNNAIDLDSFKYDEVTRNRYRAELGLENCFVIGHVGRFSYQKNHKFLIDVFNEVSKERKDARLMLIGKGPLESEIEKQVRSYGIADKVLFLGKRNDVNALYNAMDVFCFPSHFEGLGMVLIEAQANGLYCIGSDNIPNEARIDSNNKFLPHNVLQWKKNMLEICEHTNRKERDNQLELDYDIHKQIKVLEEEYIK